MPTPSTEVSLSTAAESKDFDYSKVMTFDFSKRSTGKLIEIAARLKIENEVKKLANEAMKLDQESYQLTSLQEMRERAVSSIQAKLHR